MRRTSALLAALALSGALAACGGDTGSGSNSNAHNANNSGTAHANDNTGSASDNANAQGREGLIDTSNNNLKPNANSKTVDSGTAVLTNDNGNKNTAGVSEINKNANRSDKGKGNANH